MIYDKLENASLYAAPGSRIAKAFDFLRRPDLATVALGRHDIDGDNVFALVQTYDTKPREQGKWEAHRKYIDVQYVIAGDECIGYATLSTLKITKEYDDKDDYLLAEGSGDFVRVHPGMFAVLHPQDAHMPCTSVTQPSKVRKVVVKVRVQ